VIVRRRERPMCRSLGMPTMAEFRTTDVPGGMWHAAEVTGRAMARVDHDWVGYGESPSLTPDSSSCRGRSMQNSLPSGSRRTCQRGPS